MKNMKITREPEVCFGKYVIQGTRIIVSELLENLPEYESWSELVSEYPSLSEYTEEEMLLRNVEPEENSMEYKWLRRYRSFLKIKTGREIKRVRRKLAELIILDLLSLIEPSDDRYKSALRI